ncbi:GNAT family N-acetyltransferase [Neomegalonema perideroedes]|uniref:GNAT family N-acetyltransferase n=1 Tax=Neomegalonema perideroedes TaxID=217219 RepID=UPI00035E5674|nr:N-acetyltransferase [Neomegalonema perideroedes]
MKIEIREERPEEAPAVRLLTEAAFKLNAHSRGTEGAVVDALRAAGALTLSLVAIQDGELVGHVAFSPVRIEGADPGWFGLGPVSARPDLHGRGIGGALVREGLARLKAQGAKGCLLVGDQEYYRRFGFRHDPALKLEGVPPEYLLALTLEGPRPAGNVVFHEGFSAS